MSLRAQPDEPFFDGEMAAEPSRTPWRPERLARSLILVMLCIALAPLAIAGSVGFFQYRALIHREELNQLRWHAERAVHTLELYLDGLRHDIIVTANGSTTAELADREHLDEALTRLRDKHPSLVDLSLIDPRGIQIAYAGPYDLAGKEYTSSPWYAKTLARKVHVSEVFMGFRNVPHFVIAASKKEPPRPGFWVVRASVDAESLDRLLADLGTDALDDVFLASEDGVLQTSSRFYGKASSPFVLGWNLGPKPIDVAEVTRGSAAVLQAAARVQNTPWTLVLEQDKYGSTRLWSAFAVLNFSLFAYQLTLDPAKKAEALILPKNPQIGLFAITLEAPANAGNNFTKNSWYPNTWIMINERNDIRGGVEANPQDTWLPMEK